MDFFGLVSEFEFLNPNLFSFLGLQPGILHHLTFSSMCGIPSPNNRLRPPKKGGSKGLRLGLSQSFGGRCFFLRVSGISYGASSET